MITRIFILLLIVQANLGCSEPFVEEGPEEEFMETENEMDSLKNDTYLALGDSYTIGQSVPEEDRFPEILVRKLKDMGIPYEGPRIIAKTGWTTDELAAAIEKENIQDTFELVTLLIGVNNQYRGRDVENFRTEFIDLLEQSIAFAGGKKENVIVVSIPDWGVSPFAEGRDREKIAQEIDLFNSVKKEETLKKEVKFVDITAISRTAQGNADLFALDGLHFSGLMHEKWVDQIIEDCF
jgi:lysophospholipase L1-like esterase